MVAITLAPSLMAQSDFKLQAYLNCAPYNPSSYSKAGRIGIETLRPKWNYNIEYSGHYFENYSHSNYYVMDSNLYHQEDQVYRSARGISIGVSRAIQFKTHKTRFVYGVQVFGGANYLTVYTNYYRLDSNYLSPTNNSTIDDKKYLRWTGNNTINQSRYERHLSVGVALMAKLELTISKRFTFSPTLYLPYMIHNENSGSLSIVDPGLSFLLGYKLMK